MKRRKTIPVEPLIKKWLRDPAFKAEYDALEEEFSLASALIRARSLADVSQEEIAKRMHTSQPAIARLEGGSGNPSLATLRKYAQATGTQLRITFEPKAAR